MLIATLPFEYAVLLDPGDRVRRMQNRPQGIRPGKPEGRVNRRGGLR